MAGRGLILCCLVGVASAGWKDLFAGHWKDAPLHIMTSVACNNDNGDCFITGSTGHSPFQVIKAKHGLFNATTPSTMHAHSIVMWDSAAHNDRGMTVGTGALKDPAVLYSKDDAETWEGSYDIALSEGFDAEAIKWSDKSFGYAGLPNGITDIYPGLAVSHDGGAVWKGYQLPGKELNISTNFLGTGAAFPNPTTWFMAAGWGPGNNATSALAREAAPFHGRRRLVDGKLERVNLTKNHQKVQGQDDYDAIICRTQDGGKTWEKVFQSKGEFYTTDIHCWNSTLCVAGAQGTEFSTNPGAHILVSTDGGSTWTIKKTISGNADQTVTKVRMPSDKEFWVSGTIITSRFKEKATMWHSTDGGETWTDEGATVDKIVDILDMWFVSPTKAYAVALTELESGTILQYTA